MCSSIASGLSARRIGSTTSSLETSRAQHIGDDSLRDAQLLLGADSAGESNDSGSHGDIDIVRIERELFLEPVAHEGAKLVIGKKVGLL